MGITRNTVLNGNEQGLYHLPNSGRTFSLSLRALNPYIEDDRKDGPLTPEI